MQTSTRQKVIGLLYFFGSSFILHLIWENLHAPLYGPYTNFINFFPRLLYATITGDMIFMAIIFATLGIVHNDFWWILDKKVYQKPSTWILAIFSGAMIAISFELWAVYVNYRWDYRPVCSALRLRISAIFCKVFCSWISNRRPREPLSFSRNFGVSMRAS